MSVAIKIENVSKLYRLGTVGTGTIAHDLNRWWHLFRGKEDPYTKIGQVNDRTKSATDEQARGAGSIDYIWALRDINLEVQQGEILGIIGRNGAGKSTLLKLLSRVTAPTTGFIKTKGRIASLLEVGTGFHPELTGRENIYMNGAILGMRRKEITAQLHEIVEFSGCSRYIDTPVKRYSSGMMVRLGFAVAAHLRCEVLVVDEVLAVGDADFQRKCLGKMRDVASGGRTILFVSHNMAAVQSLCQRGILMNYGTVADDGDTIAVIRRYLSAGESQTITPLADRQDRRGDGAVRIMSLSIESTETGSLITSTCSLRFKLRYVTNKQLQKPKVMIGIYDENDVGFYGLDSSVAGELPNAMPLDGVITCETAPINLTAGRCFVNVAFFNDEVLADHVINAASFTIESTDFFGNGRTISRAWMPGLLRHKWLLT